VVISRRVGSTFPLSRAGYRDAFRLLHLAVALVASLLLVPQAAAQDAGEERKPPSASCRDCGTVRSIREVRTERQLSRPDIYVTSPQYLDTRPNDPPRIGPVFSLSWGRNEQPQPRIGAVGSPQMQQRFTEITYEVVVLFDDGRYGLFEQDDASNLRVGDRVEIVSKRVERIRP
jgi:hypothetical protein